MASAFDTLMRESAAPVFFNLMGDAVEVLYTKANAEYISDVTDADGNRVLTGASTRCARQCTAIIEDPSTSREEIQEQEEDEKLRRVVVLSTDPDSTYGYVIDVELGGTITINKNEVWGIAEIESHSETFIRVVVEFWYIRERDRMERI